MVFVLWNCLNSMFMTLQNITEICVEWHQLNLTFSIPIIRDKVPAVTWSYLSWNKILVFFSKLFINYYLLLTNVRSIRKLINVARVRIRPNPNCIILTLFNTSTHYNYRIGVFLQINTCGRCSTCSYETMLKISWTEMLLDGKDYTFRYDIKSAVKYFHFI